jgi:hypothetical protein
MRARFFSLAVLLALGATASAAEKLNLSRLIDLDFRHPGKVAVLDTRGKAPVSEEVRKNSYVLVLAQEVKLTLSIGNDNVDEEHYYIILKGEDGLHPEHKIEEKILPDETIKTFWLSQYRYQFITVGHLATAKGDFVTALVSMEVYEEAPK